MRRDLWRGNASALDAAKATNHKRARYQISFACYVRKLVECDRLEQMVEPGMGGAAMAGYRSTPIESSAGSILGRCAAFHRPAEAILDVAFDDSPSS